MDSAKRILQKSPLFNQDPFIIERGTLLENRNPQKYSLETQIVYQRLENDFDEVAKPAQKILVLIILACASILVWKQILVWSGVL